MKNLRQLIRCLTSVALSFVLTLQGTAQEKQIKSEPSDKWNAPFVKVKKNSPNILWIFTFIVL